MPRGEHPNSRANLKRGKAFNAETAPKAAEKSQKAKRSKRLMRDWAIIALQTPVPMSNDKAKALAEKLGLDVDELTFEALGVFKQAQKAADGDLRALEFLRDTAGESPNREMGSTDDSDAHAQLMAAIRGDDA